MIMYNYQVIIETSNINNPSRQLFFSVSVVAYGRN